MTDRHAPEIHSGSGQPGRDPGDGSDDQRREHEAGDGPGAGAHRADGVADVLFGHHVQPDGRFVQQEQLGLVQEGGCHPIDGCLDGDDFFTTNPGRVGRGIAERSANAVLVKMNQIGTLTETFEVLALARHDGDE